MSQHPYTANFAQVGRNGIDLGGLTTLCITGDLLYPAQPRTPGIFQIRQIVQRLAITFEFFKMVLYIGILTGVVFLVLVINNVDVVGEELIHRFIEILKLSDVQLRIAWLLRQPGVGLWVVGPGAL
ncbi:MAG TPA: hypothetical protein VF099_09495 [Ktedonobacterales bacterium]